MQEHQRVTRSDLEKKFKELQDEVQGSTERNKMSLATAAAVGGVVVVFVAYALGRRSGRKRRSVLEIRR